MTGFTELVDLIKKRNWVGVALLVLIIGNFASWRKLWQKDQELVEANKAIASRDSLRIVEKELSNRRLEIELRTQIDNNQKKIDKLEAKQQRNDSFIIESQQQVQQTKIQADLVNRAIKTTDTELKKLK